MPKSSRALPVSKPARRSRQLAKSSPLSKHAKRSEAVHSEVEFGGYRTRALIKPGRGLTVLCLHGWSDNADAFQAMFEALADTAAQLIALDLPGFGEGPALSPRPQPVLPQIEAFALAAIDQYARRGPILLLGHSLGGRTVLAAAAKRPKSVLGVIALAPAPLRLRLWLRVVAAERLLLPRLTRALRFLPNEFAARRYLRGFQRTFYAPRSVDPAIFKHFSAYLDAARMAQYTEGLHRVAGELSVALELSRLKLPVQLVWGGNDRLVPPVAAEPYRAQIPHARYLQIPGCGHAIPQERPEVIARLIRTRLAELESSTVMPSPITGSRHSRRLDAAT